MALNSHDTVDALFVYSRLVRVCRTPPAKHKVLILRHDIGRSSVTFLSPFGNPRTGKCDNGHERFPGRFHPIPILEEAACFS